MKKNTKSSLNFEKKIWIDLDNSPHVPFFVPIITELKNHDYQTLITARRCFQVCGLANHYNLQYSRVGIHYGKNKVLKVLGTIYRAMQLVARVTREKPKLALSHGSRAQLLASKALGIKSMLIFDYEYTQGIPLIHPDWVITPEIVPDTQVNHIHTTVLRYPGIKEDVYVPDFQPDSSILTELGIKANEMVITIRPPATQAHYHNPESEKLFQAVVDFLAKKPQSQLVILPRDGGQTAFIHRRWPDWFTNGKIIIPKTVVDGLNLMWHSDFVISGGGTMNREAAALGVPVYSIFRGKIGAVDQYLSDVNRLVMLKSVEDVYAKIVVSRRDKSFSSNKKDNKTLNKIVEHIEAITETMSD